MNRVSISTLLLLIPVALLSVASLCAASKEPVRGRNGMVVSAEAHASQVGVDILKQGGNAVDAAVAVGFALAVTFPQAGNIGGGGFMVIRMADGRTATIDFREKAPQQAHRDMYLDSTGAVDAERSLVGHLSAGVPGSVAGLLHALEKYGTKSRREAMAPAVRLAEKGFEVSHRFAQWLKADSASLVKYAETKRIFTRHGHPFKEGERLVQKDLGATLRRIQNDDTDGFYKGKTADLIVEEMKRGNGLISHDDLRSYRAVERPPVIGTYRGYELISMGPPSSGGIVLIQMLNLLEAYDLGRRGPGSSWNITRMTESMKLAYADRAEYLGDPDFFPVPEEWLVSKEYARERRALIDTMQATPSLRIRHGVAPARESEETTHYSVVDRWGNAVSVTTTINSWFGSYVTVKGAGFLLNNEMDDFSAKPGVPNQYGLIGGEANAIAPQKRMLSAMTPTIILRDKHPWIVTGSPGGSTIITTILQVITNVIDYKMNIQEAIDAPRIHHQWLPDTLVYERHALVHDVREHLATRGYNVKERHGTQGRAEGILIDRERGIIFGATDPRGYGAAIGY